MPKKSVKRERRSYGDEFRRNAISLVEDRGYTNAQAARELGINQNLLRTWREKYGKSAPGSSGLSEGEQDELDRLRQENRRLRMERDILKKATAFFANEKN
jgi:transposase